MHGRVWILDGNEDNLSMAAIGLAQAGVRTLEFSSSDAFLSRARSNAHELPSVAIIDAKTALGWERDIRNAVYSRLVVLTTWPAQLAAWLSVGASRFLLKPFTIESLVEHVDPDGFLVRARSLVKAPPPSADRSRAA